MKLRKRIAAFGAAMVMAVSMMSIGASASVTYFWSIYKASPYQPESTVYCSDEVTGLTSYNDDAIDFYCSYMSSSDSDVKFDIESNFKRDSNQYAYLYYATDSDQIKFRSYWWNDPACSDGKCTCTGRLYNDYSYSFNATGTAS